MSVASAEVKIKTELILFNRTRHQETHGVEKQTRPGVNCLRTLTRSSLLVMNRHETLLYGTVPFQLGVTRQRDTKVKLTNLKVCQLCLL